MGNSVVVTEELLRWLADNAVRFPENMHGLIDQLDGAVGRDELARRVKLAAETPEQRAARRAELERQLAEV
jgi:hypothetical protein